MNQKVFDKKFLLVLILSVVIVFIIIPVIFNFIFLFPTPWTKGSTSDWFTFFSGLGGGLIGGIFTYIAIIYSLNSNKNERVAIKNKLSIKIIMDSLNYLEKIHTEVLNVQLLIEEETVREMDNQFERQLEVQEGIQIFQGKIEVSEIDDLKERIELIVKYSDLLKERLLDTYLELNYLEQDINKYCYDGYHLLDMYITYFEGIIDNNDFTKKEFLYTFISSYDNVGFKGAIEEMNNLAFDVLYPKYIKNDDYIGDFIRENIQPHIRG
ncbi:hypothetical protein GLW03_08485 [Halobacillus halophilus]|uniref:hypothetical protein n=1 Tax=Halobacillus halophilus TaxID=1570 RepID=UPI00137143F4|nr:hypothetical protein [Halobacillus halophilus]MYL29850.1 hypothetical protein [Halobacillus halophilus]